MSEIKWTGNRVSGLDCEAAGLMALNEIEKARAFFQTFPQYKETPLVSLGCLAGKLGVSGLFVKDESYRFGLNAFKVLGGTYAMAKYIAKKLGKDITDLPYETLISDAVRSSLGEMTFYTATDGNHGRGVAWAANRLRQKAVIYMPDGSSEIRRDKIRQEGAVCEIIEGMNYDDCVRLAASDAEKSGNAVIVQDTAWEGYEEIPTWIMQGYGTMALEAAQQLKELGADRPTHIFLQAGVGSFSGSVLGFFRNLFPKDCPIVTIVEPEAADCLYRSAVSGRREIVAGEMRTIMAGLACGEPNVTSWEILKNYASCFVSCPDWVAAKGMRVLSSPVGNDKRVISGESGAVPLGLITCLMAGTDLEPLKNELALDGNSRVLVISTEGDTDPAQYRTIVWDGLYPSAG